MRIHAVLGSGHEECSGLVQREQATEIQITAIHHIERTWLEGQHIRHVDIEGLAVRDMNEGRDVAAQIEQRMQLDRSLGGAERCPRKQRQTQVDSRGIQGVDGVVQVDAETVVAMELAHAG